MGETKRFEKGAIDGEDAARRDHEREAHLALQGQRIFAEIHRSVGIRTSVLTSSTHGLPPSSGSTYGPSLRCSTRTGLSKV